MPHAQDNTDRREFPRTAANKTAAIRTAPQKRTEEEKEKGEGDTKNEDTFMNKRKFY